MELVAIDPEGGPASPIDDLPAIARDVVRSTEEMYRTAGHHPPWVGYLGFDGPECVGTCAFKSAPVDGRVEIAYFTFPDHEGRGVATRMAGCLLDVAAREAPEVVVTAQTLPETNASTRILEKLGFRKTGELVHPEDGIVWEWERTTES